jgi:hypothetical protein
MTEPRYFARLNGPRFFEMPASIVNEEETSFALLDGLLHLVNPTATGFTARVLVLSFGRDQGVKRLLATTGTDGEGGEVIELEGEVDPATVMVSNAQLTENNPLSEWTIVWMGVEG